MTVVTLPPLAYSRSCVPVALAALLELPVDQVAGLLFAAGAARRLDHPGGASPFGTPMLHAADTISRLGYGLEWFHADGSRDFGAQEVARMLASWRQRQVGQIRRAPRPVHGDAASTSPHPAPPAALSVAGWSRQHPAGLWLLHITWARPGSHALAMVDGRVVAGGDFPRAPVVLAFRILPGGNDNGEF